MTRYINHTEDCKKFKILRDTAAGMAQDSVSLVQQLYDLKQVAM